MSEQVPDNEGSEERDIPRLLAGIASDSLVLAGQQLKLIQLEVQSEIAKTGRAGLLLGAGAGLLAGGAVLSSVALVHLLHQNRRVPLWASYGLVAGVSAAAGLHCWRRGRQLVSEVELPVLPQVRESLQENLTWLRDQVIPSAE